MICGGGSTIIFLSAEEYLFYYLYSASLSLSPPLVRCSHMCFHHACWIKLIFHADISCAHFPCVQKYLLENSGKILWGFPCLGSVAAWRVQVLRLLIFPPPPVWFLCILISSCFICCILVSSWGGVLDTSMATLANEVGWTVDTMVGAVFGVGVYSISWGG